MKAVNKIDICKKEYQTSHINCVEDNKFELKSLIETVKDTDGSYEIIGFKTIIIRKNTIYYLKKDGMKVSGIFDGSTSILNVDVELTDNINESSNVSTSNFVKTNVEQIRNLKAGDIIDFHLKKPNGSPLGDTECPNIKGLKYNYCAAEIIICD